MVRDSAVAIGLALGVLYVFPVFTAFIGNQTWHHRIERYTPMAGLSIQSTTSLRSLAIGPWGGLGVLALWALGALVVGGLILRFRDA
jgi:ABC-2 type transport system permease protein